MRQAALTRFDLAQGSSQKACSSELNNNPKQQKYIANIDIDLY